MSFNSLRNRIFLAAVLGVIVGGLLGTQLGQATNAQWGDLVGAITGIWLGGPVAVFLVFQLLIKKLSFELSVTRARIANLFSTIFSGLVLLVIFAAITRSGAASLLLVPVLIIANLSLAYFNLAISIRLAKK